MPDFVKAPLMLGAFALLSVLVTAVAAGLALQRPALSHFPAETRSRLVADYSSDPLAMRLSPLDRGVIEAAAQDEAELSEESSAQEQAELLPTATPARIELEASPTQGATTIPTAPPTVGATVAPSPSPRASNTPRPTSTRGPSPTATPMTPTPTFTPRPTFTPTPQPTATPPPTATAPPPTSTPPPTKTPPPPTNTPPPTATPKHLDLCERLIPPPPAGLCDLLP